MNRLDRWLNQLVLANASAPARRPAKARPEAALPGERRTVRHDRRAAHYVLAVVLPFVVAASLIPVRASHLAAAALVMVLPVVIVAIVGTTGPAIVAAVSAALGFNAFLTEPYYTLVISDPDEIIVALTLGAVGLIVGVLGSRLARLAARDDARGNELRQLIAFLDETGDATSSEELGVLACEHLTSLLGLHRCEWLPHALDAVAPVLLSSGAVLGQSAEMNPDRAKLPHHLALPVMVDGTQQGCFLMTSAADRTTSIEERRTAAMIGAVFGRELRRLPR